MSVAPFKAQNVSNNSKVCKDGSEIAIAQYFQAEVLGVAPTFHNNPILLKSAAKNRAHLLVEGKFYDTQGITEYFCDIHKLKPIVKRNFEYLADKYDVIIAEGAGSPVELNLMEQDLSNIYVATEFDTKIILIADIEKGGVFASIFGVLNLLPKELAKNVIGVIINKFRGDISLFDKGVEIIEKEFHIPVLGVVPYLPLNIGFEDAQSLQNYVHTKKDAKIKVAVIHFPHMSNYNDFEPLIIDDAIALDFVKNGSLESYDIVILPGSKLVMQDLLWLKDSGLFEEICHFSKTIFGICGGYEMLFEKIIDGENIESDFAEIAGFGFVDDVVIFKSEKITKNETYEIFGMQLEGYEIHNGTSEKYPLFFQNGRILGTFLHGIFDNDAFREMLFKVFASYQGYDFKVKKAEILERFLENTISHIDTKKVVASVL